MMHIVAAGVLTPKVMALIHANLLPRPAEVVAHAGQALYRFKSFIDDATPNADLPIGNIQEVGRHLTDVTTAAETCPALFKNIPWFHEKVKEVMAEWIELLKSTQAKLEKAGQAIDEYKMKFEPVTSAITTWDFSHLQWFLDEEDDGKTEQLRPYLKRVLVWTQMVERTGEQSKVACKDASRILSQCMPLAMDVKRKYESILPILSQSVLAAAILNTEGKTDKKADTQRKAAMHFVRTVLKQPLSSLPLDLRRRLQLGESSKVAEASACKPSNDIEASSSVSTTASESSTAHHEPSAANAKRALKKAKKKADSAEAASKRDAAGGQSETDQT